MVEQQLGFSSADDFGFDFFMEKIVINKSIGKSFSFFNKIAVFLFSSLWKSSEMLLFDFFGDMWYIVQKQNGTHQIMMSVLYLASFIFLFIFIL